MPICRIVQVIVFMLMKLRTVLFLFAGNNHMIENLIG
jgi:hypothetical protein